MIEEYLSALYWIQFFKNLLKDNYETIDNNMSDSNIGARKRKNIRNHTFIINGKVNDAATSRSKPVDLAILDFKSDL